MYSIGQTVLYGTNGVCEIVDITMKKIGKSEIEYYVLKPVCSGTSTLFVPTHNQQLVDKIRNILSESEIHAILQNLPEAEEWNDNKVERTEAFRAVIAGGDCAMLIRLIRQIKAHEAVQTSKGKRLHLSDERLLKEAEKMVCDEISLVLNVDRNEVIEMILK